MYEEFFGLQRRPFAATPDANGFVPLEAHQGVLDALAVSCERGQGIAVLTGGVGLGKSLVGLRLAFELQPTFATVFLGHSAYATRRALLQAILFELNRPFDRKAEQELRLELMAALKALRQEKQGLVLIVDEAHRLSVPLLDELRLMTLLAEGSEPLARVVLIGDCELEERLADPALAAFNQRVSCQVDLATLTQTESLEYLSASLELAGGEAEEIFTEDALTFLAKAADGVPRCLNHLADHALLLAYVTERRPISAEVVREALDDLKQLPLHWNDPLNGGEVYRGFSHRPAMEDSAVDLWPQRNQPVEDEPGESHSWADSEFGGSSSAIEIGGELNKSTAAPQKSKAIETEHLTCLKDNWQTIERPSSSVEEILANVAKLTQALEDEQDSPTLGQVFDAKEHEFGAPSPESFAVEEFTAENSDIDVHEDRWAPQDDDDSCEPVWNLPDRSWSIDDDRSFEFEEEPVIDRYVRIASGSRTDGVVWNHHKPHTQATAKRTVTAVKTTKLVVAASGFEAQLEGTNLTHESQESHPTQPLESVSDVRNSGIVENYSRNPRVAGHVSAPTTQDSGLRNFDDHSEPEDPPHEKGDWHLPTELLNATQADDGIEEQIGMNVLDMYLDVQQSLLDQRMASGSPAISFDKPPADKLSPPVRDFEPPSQSAGDTHSEPTRETSPDSIQRAYGRLFSDLRRRKK